MTFLKLLITPKWLKRITHVAALLPLAWLLLDVYRGNLSVNPIQDITFRTGKPALVLLILSLACTPANTLFGFRQALAIRKLLGLYAFLYVSLHLLVFVGLDYGFDPLLLQEAIFEKRYALVGFAAFLILVPLAVTSTRGWMKRLGKRWKTLHRGAYLAAALAVLHYVWLVKSDIRQPVAWGVFLAVLLLTRQSWIRTRVSRLRQRLQGRNSVQGRQPGMARSRAKSQPRLRTQEKLGEGPDVPIPSMPR